jgi:hypothetical protein
LVTGHEHKLDILRAGEEGIQVSQDDELEQFKQVRKH